MQQTEEKRELEIFCRNVIFLRKAYNYSKKEMASILGVSIYTLNKLEALEFPKFLGANVIVNIRNHFGISPSNQFKPMG